MDNSSIVLRRNGSGKRGFEHRVADTPPLNSYCSAICEIHIVGAASVSDASARARFCSRSSTPGIRTAHASGGAIERRIEFRREIRGEMTNAVERIHSCAARSPGID